VRFHQISNEKEKELLLKEMKVQGIEIGSKKKKAEVESIRKERNYEGQEEE
jgi:hypothetical protein